MSMFIEVTIIGIYNIKSRYIELLLCSHRRIFIINRVFAAYIQTATSYLRPFIGDTLVPNSTVCLLAMGTDNGTMPSSAMMIFNRAKLTHGC